MKAATLTETELHQLKWIMGGLLALIASWSLATVDFGANSLGLAAFALISLILAVPRLPGLIPALAWKLTTPVLVGVVILDIALNFRMSVLAPVMRSTLLITLLRAFEYRKSREDLQLTLLSLFCIVVTGVITASLTFALQILLLTPLAMTQLFLINLLEPSRARTLTAQDWRSFEWPTFLNRLRQSINIRLVGIAFILFSILAGMSWGIFILIPRIEVSQFFSLISPAQSGKIGFNDGISIGDVSNLESDSSTAFRVTPPAIENVPASLYWRMLVLDEYSPGGRFTSSRNHDLRRLQVTSDTNTIRMPAFPGAFRGKTSGPWDIFLEGDIAQYVPLIGPFETVKVSHKATLSLDPSRLFVKMDRILLEVTRIRVDTFLIPDTQALPASGLESTLNSLSTAQKRAYFTQQNATAALYPLSLLSAALRPEEKSWLTSAVDQISGNTLLDAPAFATRAVAYLNARHRYTLDNSKTSRETFSKAARGQPDPLIQWMQEGNNGWCEHFASSMVLLCRAAGIPARVIVGYSGAEWNPFEGYLLVRNRNAHAWVEVFHQNQWLHYDPTPAAVQTSGDAASGGPSSGIRRFSGITAWIDSLRVAWYRKVVNFNARDQEKMATEAVQKGDSLIASVKKAFSQMLDAVRSFFAQDWSLDRLLDLLKTGLVAVAVIAFAVFIAKTLNQWLLQRSQWFRQTVALSSTRRRAGHWLARLQQLPEGTSSSSAELQVLRQKAIAQLAALRFGPLSGNESPDEAIRQGRHALRLLLKDAKKPSR